MKKLLLSMVLVSLPMSAFADFSCQAVPTVVLVYGEGSVNVFHAGRNDYTYVCNVTTPRLGIDPVTCAMWTAILLSAKKDNRLVSFYYAGSGTCATLPVYSNSPAPYYIG
jgi:hypothetical protein